MDSNGGSTVKPPEAPWGEEYQCNDGIWVDKTLDGACDSTGDDCMYQDTLTGSYWSELSPGNANWDMDSVASGDWPCGPSSCTASGGNVTVKGTGTIANGSEINWWNAIYACDELDFGGFQDWRLPQMHEYHQAIMHNINDASAADFGTLSLYVWTSTTAYVGTYAVIFWSSTSDSQAPKINPFNFRCVRP